jgi:hypothetical protein
VGFFNRDEPEEPNYAIPRRWDGYKWLEGRDALLYSMKDSYNELRSSDNPNHIKEILEEMDDYVDMWRDHFPGEYMEWN